MDATIFGIQQSSAETLEDLEDRIAIVIHKLKFFSLQPKVACITQLNPCKLASGRLAQTIHLAGGIAVAAVNWDSLLEENPEIIILALEGNDINTTISEIQNFIALPSLSEIEAVKNNKIYISNSEKYLEEEGVKAVDALEIFAEIITPKYFNFGFEGDGWVKFEM